MEVSPALASLVRTIAHASDAGADASDAGADASSLDPFDSGADAFDPSSDAGCAGAGVGAGVGSGVGAGVGAGVGEAQLSSPKPFLLLPIYSAVLRSHS